jgi:hypothetical protein
MGKRIILWFSALLTLVFALAGCTVVKKPYFTSDYYRETIDSLQGSTHEENHSGPLLAGFSRISITPDLSGTAEYSPRHYKGIPIAGFGQLKTKYATAIHDSIFVRSVAMKSGKEAVIITSADILIMPPNVIDSVVEKLKNKGISRDQLFFSASHSHSSIGGWGYGPLAKIIAGKENKKLEKWLTDRIVEAVLSAISDLRPARSGSGSFYAPQYTRNRLTGDEEQNNDEFNYLLIEQVNGRKCIIGTYSAHATTTGSKNTLISSDYPGYWSRKIEGKSTIAMFCGGSMGSQSPEGEGSGFDRTRFIGEGLADSTLKHIMKTDMHESTLIDPLSLRIALPRYHMRMTRNLNYPTCFSRWLMPQPENVYLQALRINDLIWLTAPGDFSGESALLIKNILAGKGYEAVVSGYNGSYVGYIIPGKYFYLDNYESKGMGWFGPTMGDYVTDLMLRMADTVIQ